MLGLLLGAALLNTCDNGNDTDLYDEDYTDDWLKPSTDEWRDSHPDEYNEYTGGWNADEDEENGW